MDDHTSNVERAIQHAKCLKEKLDALYNEREAGVSVSAERLDTLESLIEKCAMHEALADSLAGS